MPRNIVFRLDEQFFEWDSDKAQSNERKHGITFVEAAGVFFDPQARYEEAPAAEEYREQVIGFSLAERLLIVVHVERGVRIRLISARRATAQERKRYESR